jgi:hypothetical protein
MAYRKNSKPTKEEMMSEDEQKMMLEDGTEISIEMEDGMEVEIETPEEETGVTEDELHGIVAGEIDDAQAYIDDVISPERAMAGQYYKGEPFGNEEEGRSQVISMDVRDTVQAIMPSIMRVFFGSSNVVEFAPNGPEDIQNAEQATDYVNYCLTRDNNLFMVCYETFKDALVRKNGISKVWWNEDEDVQTYNFEGLSEEAYTVLASDPDVEIVEVEMETGEMAMMGPDGIEIMVPKPTEYSCTIRRTTKKGRLCVAAVPPEEFLIDRRARNIEDAEFVAHRRYVTVSDLVKMGYEMDEIENLGYETQDDFEGNQETFDRNPNATILGAGRTDLASRKILYIEGYVRVDMDGDGIAELRRVCVGGSAYKILHNERCDLIPFVSFCPDPEPHTFFGLSIADVTMDIQLIKSNILRNMLDSLAQSIHPRTAVVEGQVNLEDVMNTEVGGIIRMRAPGMVQPFSQPFVGQAAFPMLAYMDELRENRTGISKAAAGLDANALQSSTRAAVAATITAAQQHIELICRIFAETGMKVLFEKALKLITMYQDAPRMVRLRNQFVPIDPRVWNSNMDVVVNVALGSGTTEEKMNFLGQIAAKQEMLIQQGGVDNNPLVDLSQYRNTLAQMLAMAGFKDADMFFKNPALNPPPPPPPPPPPSPEQILAQVQVQAIQADIQKKAAELELQREEMLRKDDRERDKIDADVMIKAAEIEAKYGAQVNTARIEAMMQRDRDAMRQQAETQRAVATAAVQAAQAAQAAPAPEQTPMPPEGMM